MQTPDLDLLTPPNEPLAVRIRVLRAQVALLQNDRVEFAQRNRVLEHLLTRMDKQMTELLAELATLRTDRVEPVREAFEALQRERPEPLPPVLAPKPPWVSTDKGGGGAKGRHAHGRNTQTPAGIAVDEALVDVEACGACGSADLRVHDRVDRIAWDYVRPHFRKRIERCQAVKCNVCLAYTTATGTPRPFGLASCTSGMLAQVTYGKYGMFLPLERQLGEMKRRGVTVSQATLVYWVGKSADVLGPVVIVLWAQLMATDTLNFDGTGLKVLRGKGKAHHGHLYVFASGDVAVYRYLETKHGSRLERTLSEFGGVGVADAESANGAVFASGERVEAGCNAHAFRKFRDALAFDVEVASEGMAWIAAMYRAEAEAKVRKLTGRDLHRHRQAEVLPIAAQFRLWLDAQASNLLPESAAGKAVRYYRTQWPNLTRFLSDPTVPIDNNDSERALKPAALLRKNCLFAGSEAGAGRAATHLTVVETCKRHGVDAELYLAWVYDQRGRRRGTPAEHQVEDLTPSAYKARAS